MIDPLKRVSVVTVTYNSAAVIESCLRSVAGAGEIIVVDNASADDTAARIRSIAPQARIIANTVNQGFGRANNQGAALATGEFIFFLNPDSDVTPGSIASLVAAADAHREAVLLGPQILNRNGRVVISHDADLPSRLAMGAARDRFPAQLPEGECCVGFLSGAAIVARRTELPTPPFDERIFLFFEDDDLCLRLRQADRALLYVPGAVVRHLGGQASRPSLRLSWRKHWHMAWSRLYFERKHVGPIGLLGLRRSLLFLAKSLGYVVTGNFTKAWRDAARGTASVAFLLGVEAISQTVLDA